MRQLSLGCRCACTEEIAEVLVRLHVDALVAALLPDFVVHMQECPVEIDQLINSCLAHEPGERPSARQIWDVIRDWQQVARAKIRETRSSSQTEAARPPVGW